MGIIHVSLRYMNEPSPPQSRESMDQYLPSLELDAEEIKFVKNSRVHFVRFGKYLTPSTLLKSASCVHSVAWYSRAVASMMLSAIGSDSSRDKCAAFSA